MTTQEINDGFELYKTIINKNLKLIEEVINDVYEGLKKEEKKDVIEAYKISGYRIGELYFQMEIICATLHQKDICFTYTIEKGKMTEGEKVMKELSESCCTFNFTVKIIAFK
jgi:hypothetical protein